MKTKTVLIAGGAGFIGSYLCEKFIELGYKVIAVDNLITGSLDNLSNVLNNSNFQFIDHDINGHLKIREKLDLIINMASIASPKLYMKYPIHTLKTGSIGSLNLLDLSVKHNAKIFLASTSEVYGDPTENPQKESYNGNVSLIGPRSCYDESKRFQESAAISYMNQFKVDIRIGRIFNTYGPRMASYDGRVVPAFINQVINGDTITIFGDGNQTRSFCYISDMVDAIMGLILSDYNLPVNLGNPQEITINDIARKIISICKKTDHPISYHSLPINDPMVRCPDISLAKNLFNLSPNISLDEGLFNTVKYFNELKKQNEEI